MIVISGYLKITYKLEYENEKTELRRRIERFCRKKKLLNYDDLCAWLGNSESTYLPYQ